MIPYSRLKLSDIYTLSQSEQLENHTPHLHSGTYRYSPYMEVPPPPLHPGKQGSEMSNFCLKQGLGLKASATQLHPNFP